MPWTRISHCLTSIWPSKFTRCSNTPPFFLKNSVFRPLNVKHMLHVLLQKKTPFHMIFCSRICTPIYLISPRENWMLTSFNCQGGTQLWVGYGCAAQSFDHHPITKPEKTQICDLCLNHLFFEGPFFKLISTFYHVIWHAYKYFLTTYR